MEGLMANQWMAGTEEPIEGSTQLGPAQELRVDDWNVNALLAAWRSIGLPGDEVAKDSELVEKYHSVIEEAESYYEPGTSYYDSPVPFEVRERQSSAWSRLKDWISGRQVKVLEVAETPVRIPLFLLGCTDVKGCTAAFGHETTEARTLRWDMTIYGSGLSGQRQLTTSVSAKFSAVAGQVKMIFLDLTLPVERIDITRGNQTIGSGFQINGTNVRPAASPGLYLLSADSLPPTGEEVTRFPLSGDTTQAIATYQWTYKRSKNKMVTLGVNAFNSSLNLSYESELTDAISLTYELRGGHDYTLLSAAEGDGLLWAPATK
jgi:hypothetical protein